MKEGGKRALLIFGGVWFLISWWVDRKGRTHSFSTYTRRTPNLEVLSSFPSSPFASSWIEERIFINSESGSCGAAYWNPSWGDKRCFFPSSPSSWRFSHVSSREMLPFSHQVQIPFRFRCDIQTYFCQPDVAVTLLSFLAPRKQDADLPSV